MDTYRGHRIRFEGISYNCPTLKLYGYRDDRQLRRAIDRKLGKQSLKAKLSLSAREIRHAEHC